MVWSIFLRFQSFELQKHREESAQNAEHEISDAATNSFNSDMLSWIKKQAQVYSPELQVAGFSDKTWNDGKLFAAILSSLYPDEFAPSIVDALTPHELLNKVFTFAEKHLGVPQILNADEFLNNEYDEKDILLYLSEMRMKITQYEKEQEIENSLKKKEAEMSKHIETDAVRAIKNDLETKLKECETMISSLTKTNENLKSENAKLNEQLSKKEEQLSTTEIELKSKNESLVLKEKELQMKEAVIAEKNICIERHDEVIKAKEEEIQAKNKAISAKEDELLSKDKEIKAKSDALLQQAAGEKALVTAELDEKNKEIELKDRMLATSEEKLKARDEEVCAKVKELSEKDSELLEKTAMLKDAKMQLIEKEAKINDLQSTVDTSTKLLQSKDEEIKTKSTELLTVTQKFAQLTENLEKERTEAAKTKEVMGQLEAHVVLQTNELVDIKNRYEREKVEIQQRSQDQLNEIKKHKDMNTEYEKELQDLQTKYQLLFKTIKEYKSPTELLLRIKTLEEEVEYMKDVVAKKEELFCEERNRLIHDRPVLVKTVRDPNDALRITQDGLMIARLERMIDEQQEKYDVLA